MESSQSPHLTNIPQAIQIAASADPSVDPSLKQQALEYLQKVKERCEETWQDCLALYLQGAGASAPSATGKDGKQKLDTELRMFCEQVVDSTMISKPEVMSSEALKAMYTALVDFVQTEYVNGPCEGGQSFLRNKLSFTIAHLFLLVYPNVVITFLHPFLSLLVPSDTSSSLHPSMLVTRLLSEIALEIHDSVMRSTREYSRDRQQRDGMVRDVIRSSGDERLAVEGLLSLAGKGLSLAAGNKQWLEATQLALKALVSWTPWVDITVTLTPDTLNFYHQVLQQDIVSLRTVSAEALRTFAAKGMQDPSEKLQVLKILNAVSLVDPLESSTRDVKDDHEVVLFRAMLASFLQAFGIELIKLTELPEAPDHLKAEAESMLSEVIPLILRFLSDRSPEVPTAISGFVSELLRTFKKYVKPPVAGAAHRANGSSSMPPPPAPVPLPPQKRQFLSSVLEVVVRQLEWPEDADWEVINDDSDPDDDIEAFCAMRQSFRSVIDNIAAIDKSLHTEVVANAVVSTLDRLRSQGPSGVTWQQAELAAYLVFTFGEISKSNSRQAFYELPPELANKTAPKMARTSGKMAADSTMSSGQTTPTAASNSAVDMSSLDTTKIDYDQYPLTPLGQLLSLCMTSGLSSYPHPSVPLQFFEIAVRYVDFWKIKGAIQPMLEALLDSRGIHHSDEKVRRRTFYLLSRFIKECRIEMESSMIPIILENLNDVLPIQPKLPTRDANDETDILLKATSGKSYFQDQLYLFETAGMLVYLTRSDPSGQMNYLAAVAGPLMTGLGTGLEQYRQNPRDLSAVLLVHHHLLALGHFAKGFPPVTDDQIEAQPYQQPFKQMTEALLEALDAMKTQRVIRDGARFAFGQFVTAIGSTIAELVPRFVSSVVTEFDPTELVDFLAFQSLLMHRLKNNAFETMDMVLLPLLSRIFAVLGAPVTGTDEALIHRKLQEAYLNFFTAIMNANLEGVFITSRNKPEFENVLTSLLALAQDGTDVMSQRLAWSFFAKSEIAWGTSHAASTEPSVFAETAASNFSQKVAAGLANATNQHIISKEQRAAQSLQGYETFIYQSLIPTAFAVPADSKFNMRSGQPVLAEISVVLRNLLHARGQEGIDYLLGDLLPKLQCPPEIAQQLVQQLRTQQSKDFRKTFTEFIKYMRS